MVQNARSKAFFIMLFSETEWYRDKNTHNFGSGEDKGSSIDLILDNTHIDTSF
jgi:hypothetical protein